jgi:hypothetical protein
VAFHVLAASGSTDAKTTRADLKACMALGLTFFLDVGSRTGMLSGKPA